MAYHRYRNIRSHAGQIFSDTAHIANRLSWKGCVILGGLSFSTFYFFIPMWIHSQLNALQGNMFRPIIESLFARRIHWFQWVGITLGLISIFFAVRNYFTFDRIGRYGEKNVSFFSRILAKFMD